MIGETHAPEYPAPDQDIVRDLEEWVGRGAVPVSVGQRALDELRRLRRLVGAVTHGPTFDEIARQLGRARA